MKNIQLLKKEYFTKIALLVFCLSILKLNAQEWTSPGSKEGETKAQYEQRMQWWKDAKFGALVVWGLYSIPAGEWKDNKIGGLGEWIQFQAKIPIKDYDLLVGQFNPQKYDAEAWVKTMKQAGMKYIVITVKFCDGFALWPSKVDNFNITSTPYKKDPIKELEDACKKYGVKMGFYYSHWWDWHEENSLAGPNSRGDYYDNNWDFPDRSKKDPQQYIIKKALPQVEELVTKYDPAIIWFDVPQGITKEQSKMFLDVIKKHRPNCIVNNRVGNEMGDYITPEQYIPDKSDKNFEVCMTMNETWGYKYYDHDYKSPTIIIRNLVDIAHKGGNYMLDVDPMASGEIPSATIRGLQEIGRWLAKYGESIYGSTASPLGKLQFNGRCTAKAGKLYIHLFNWPLGNEIIIPGIKNSVQNVYLLADLSRKELPHQKIKDDILISLPLDQIDVSNLDQAVNVVVIEYKGELEILKSATLIDPAYQTIMGADEAIIKGEKLKYAARYSTSMVSNWFNMDDSMNWTIRTIRDGDYEVEITYAAPEGCENNEFKVVLGNQIITAKVTNTGGWLNPKSFLIGKIHLVKGSDITLSVQPSKLDNCSLMNLKTISLIPIIK